ncbi:MOB member 4, phocein [Balamuthia mandrillaris]
MELPPTTMPEEGSGGGGGGGAAAAQKPKGQKHRNLLAARAAFGNTNTKNESSNNKEKEGREGTSSASHQNTESAIHGTSCGERECVQQQRRNRPGTKNKDMFKWADLPVEKLDGPLAVEELLQQLIRKDPANIEALIALPPGVATDVWIYEHLRQVLKELNLFVVHHSDVCTAETAPSMKVTVGSEEYVFLCSAYNPPRECAAIDYMAHTVTQATSTLNSNRYFPSRVVIKKASAKQFGILARRLYRLFAFSYFTFRQKFDEFEAKCHLCERFTKLCLHYDLMPMQGLLIPNSRWQ